MLFNGVPECCGLRIKVIRKPTISALDELKLNRFEVGHVYEVGFRIGELMLAERWAEPVEPGRTTDRPTPERKNKR